MAGSCAACAARRCRRRGTSMPSDYGSPRAARRQTTRSFSVHASGLRATLIPSRLARDRTPPPCTPRTSTSPARTSPRSLRRFTWTSRDALDQFDKLRSVFDTAAHSSEFFQNRGLFADYYLSNRLREDPMWREDPAAIFAFVRGLYAGAQALGKEKTK